MGDEGGRSGELMAGAYDWKSEYWFSGLRIVRFMDSAMVARVSGEGLSASLVHLLGITLRYDKV